VTLLRYSSILYHIESITLMTFFPEQVILMYHSRLKSGIGEEMQVLTIGFKIYR